MKERDFDRYLNIVTTGDQIGFYESLQYHRYEPTPYTHLEQLIKEYEISASDRIVDFGCGKGRLNFYLHYTTGATVTGVEMNKDFYQIALENKKGYMKKHHNAKLELNFFLGYAQEYAIHDQDNRFYFFNPFSIHVFRNIIHRILQSVEQSYREVELILYYPSEEYIDFLQSLVVFLYKQEVVCSEGNPYEKFLIYRFAY